MLTFKIAWRNIWRNPGRTGITLASIVLSTASLIVMFSLMLGVLDRLIRNATDLGIGEVQAHAPKYLAEPSLYTAIREPGKVLAHARQHDLAAAARSLGVGLLANKTTSSGVQIWGVDAIDERAVGRLPSHVQAGKFVDAGVDHPIVLGSKLAHALGASVGTELVAVVQAADGSTGNALFHVAGIMKSVGDSMDRHVAFIARPDFEELFASSGAVHEMVFSSAGRLDVDRMRELVASADPTLDVRTWRGIAPMVADFVVLFKAVNLIIAGIFFVAAGLGVLNTLLMASYERIPEFGLIRALGATPARIVREVAAEALLLGLIGASLGGGLGLLASYRLQHHGIDLSGIGGSISMSGVALDPIWNAKVTTASTLVPLISVCFVCFAASIYPAIRAARLNTLAALNHV